MAKQSDDCCPYPYIDYTFGPNCELTGSTLYDLILAIYPHISYIYIDYIQRGYSEVIDTTRHHAYHCHTSKCQTNTTEKIFIVYCKVRNLSCYF